MKQRFSVSLACLMVALASPATSSEDGGSGNYADLVKQQESGGDYGATTTLGTASGAYQFTFATLKGLGMVKSGSTPAFGEGEWSGVEWTGKHGINSRADFLASQSAQDAVFSEFTSNNWGTISSSVPVGDTVNGVPMTQSGALHAAHMLGAGGFNQWASCGYQPQCLNMSQASANNMTREQFQAHLMKRVAEGGGYDASMVLNGEFGEDGVVQEIPMVGLMDWKAPAYSQIRGYGGV